MDFFHSKSLQFYDSFVKKLVATCCTLNDGIHGALIALKKKGGRSEGEMAVEGMFYLHRRTEQVKIEY